MPTHRHCFNEFSPVIGQRERSLIEDLSQGRQPARDCKPGPPLDVTTVSRCVGEMAEEEERHSSGAVEGGGTGDPMALRIRLT